MDVKTSRHRAPIIEDKYEYQECRESSCSLDQVYLCRLDFLEVGITQTDTKEALKQKKHRFLHAWYKDIAQHSSHPPESFSVFPCIRHYKCELVKGNKAALHRAEAKPIQNQSISSTQCLHLSKVQQTVLVCDLYLPFADRTPPLPRASLPGAGEGWARGCCGELGVCLPFSQGCVCSLCRHSLVNFEPARWRCG